MTILIKYMLKLKLIQIPDKLLGLFNYQIHILISSINKDMQQNVILIFAAEIMDQNKFSNLTQDLLVNGEIITVIYHLSLLKVCLILLVRIKIL